MRRMEDFAKAYRFRTVHVIYGGPYDHKSCMPCVDIPLHRVTIGTGADTCGPPCACERYKSVLKCQEPCPGKFTFFNAYLDLEVPHPGLLRLLFGQRPVSQRIS